VPVHIMASDESTTKEAHRWSIHWQRGAQISPIIQAQEIRATTARCGQINRYCLDWVFTLLVT
jgi:hypothetical protein